MGEETPHAAPLTGRAPAGCRLSPVRRCDFPAGPNECWLVAEGEGVLYAALGVTCPGLPRGARPPVHPSISLRANGLPGWPRRTLGGSVWVPACALGMTRDGRRRRLGARPPAAGWGRLRQAQVGSAPTPGSRGCDGGGDAPPARPPAGFAIREAPLRRPRSGGSWRWTGGVGATGPAPRPVPLWIPVQLSRRRESLRRNDEVCRRYDEVWGCGGIDGGGGL